MATAHPAKFPDAVERATGVRPALPAHLADLYERPERTETIPNDLAVVEDYVLNAAPVGSKNLVSRWGMGVSSSRTGPIDS